MTDNEQINKISFWQDEIERVQKIIVINGVAKSGKDTFVKFFMKHSHVTVFEWSSVDTVKAIAAPAFGWDGEKDEPGRRFLSDLKAAWTRYNNGPFKELAAKINNYDNWYDDFVFFIHVREPEEIQKILDAWPGRVTTILIDKPALKPPQNHADQKARDFNYDVHIDNSTTLKSLEFAAEQLAKTYTALNICPKDTVSL